MNFDIWVSFKNLSRKLVSLKSDKNNPTLREDICTFMIKSRRFILKMRNVSDKSCREDQNEHLCSLIFFPRESWRLWDNVEKYGRDGESTDSNIIWRIRFAYQRTKAWIHTLKIVELVDFPLQQWLCEGALVLRYTSIACLVTQLISEL